MTVPNNFYETSDLGRDHTKATARDLRAELRRIQQGFGKFPSISDIAFGRTFGGKNLPTTTRVRTTTRSRRVTSPISSPASPRGSGEGPRQFIALKTSDATDPTIEVDGIGDATIKEINGSDLPVGGIAAGWVIDLIHDGNFFRSQNTANRQANFLLISQDIGGQGLHSEPGDRQHRPAEGKQGNAPYTYRLTGLPAGLAFDRDTRILSGTPTDLGTSTVTYTVTDANGLVATQRFRITVLDAVNLTLPRRWTWPFWRTCWSPGSSCRKPRAVRPPTSTGCRIADWNEVRSGNAPGEWDTYRDRPVCGDLPGDRQHWRAGADRLAAIHHHDQRGIGPAPARTCQSGVQLHEDLPR